MINKEAKKWLISSNGNIYTYLLLIQNTFTLLYFCDFSAKLCVCVLIFFSLWKKELTDLFLHFNIFCLAKTKCMIVLKKKHNKNVENT